jgi:hypothetical protein
VLPRAAGVSREALYQTPALKPLANKHSLPYAGERVCVKARSRNHQDGGNQFTPVTAD